MKTFAEHFLAEAKAIPANIRNKINNEIHAITQGYHQQIPVKALFNMLNKYGYQAVQEDGTDWSGFLVGGAECGSPEANNQRVHFTLVSAQDRTPVNSSLFLSWCKMHQSGNYELVAYLS